MRKVKKTIGLVTIIMLLTLQISVTVFAETDTEIQNTESAQQPSSEQQSSELDATLETTESSNAAPPEEGAPPEESSSSSEVTEPSSSEATEEETQETEETLPYTEIDLSKGSVLITADTISQGADRSWEIFNQDKEIIVTGEGGSVTVEGYDGVITLRNATITNSMKLTNNSMVSLKLEGDNTINAAEKSSALEVSRDNTVIITGDGSLTATGDGGGAGIGGIPNSGSDGSYKKDERVCGTISILGGTIYATGKEDGAGIGGAGHCDGGTITIGGDANVTATADKGAGIGSGLGSHETEGNKKGPGYYNGGTIRIKDQCTVRAIGGWNAAGIGGGYCADSGYIYIEGGTITATGGAGNARGKDGPAVNHGGAGIGGGYEGHGNVIISGGDITANGNSTDENNSAAGIGSGGTPNSNTKRDKKARGIEATLQNTEVTILGGTIDATGGPQGGAGIGGGAGADDVQISISGGVIKATGAESTRSAKRGGAGIGGGISLGTTKYGADTALSVKINGGTITSTGGWGASGIGSGADNIRANSIAVTGGDIQAFADGTKFAIDTFNRDKTPATGASNVTAWTGSDVLQGTFVGTDAAQEYEGLGVSIYKDADPTSDTGNLIYGNLVKSTKLPGGYRSFAMTTNSNDKLLIKGGENWFGVDTAEKSEAEGKESEFTQHFKTGSATLSDNYWLYPGKTQAEESNLGTLNVTKEVTENGMAKAVTDTFYLGLFTDESFQTFAKSEAGDNAIIPIKLMGKSTETVENINLPAGTYYAAEVNGDGSKVNETATHKITTKIGNAEGSKLVIEKDKSSNVTITNAYTRLDPVPPNQPDPPVQPDQPAQQGTLKVTKNVTMNGEAYNTTNTYYVGIFDDPFFTKPATNTAGQKMTASIGLNNSSTGAMDNISIPLGTYYVAEVDSDGVPIVSSPDHRVLTAVDGIQTAQLTVAAGSKPHVEITNAYEEAVNPYIEGQFSATKHVTMNGEDHGVKDTFYLGVFNNKDFTDVTINADDEQMIIPIELDGDVEATLENIDIPLGTFYVTEVNKTGKPVESNEGLNVTVTVDGIETSQMEVREGEVPQVKITNDYIEDGPQYYMEGTIHITKKTFMDNKPHEMKQATYYAGVFTDENYGTLLNDDTDEPVILPLKLEDSSQTAISVDVPVGAGGSEATYYVAEVTKDGDLITKDSGMAFIPNIKGGTATVTGTKEAKVTMENNYSKENAPTKDNSSDKPNSSGKGTATTTGSTVTNSTASGSTVQTGDESAATIPIILLITAVALIAAVVVRRKSN